VLYRESDLESRDALQEVALVDIAGLAEWLKSVGRNVGASDELQVIAHTTSHVVSKHFVATWGTSLEQKWNIAGKEYTTESVDIIQAVRSRREIVLLTIYHHLLRSRSSVHRAYIVRDSH